MSSNRETARDALAALLQTVLVGSGLPAQAVYNYQVGDLAGQSPVVVVSSGGSERQRLSFQGSRATFRLNVYVFVVYTDGGDWNEDDAEDRLDLIEKTIAETLDVSQRTASWESVNYAGETTCDSVEIGGVEYRRETIPVTVEVYA